MAHVDRNEAIARIRAALKRRSGKTWSVRGNRGTAWGWIDVLSPPRRLGPDGMTEAERAELAQLFGLDRPVHHQGLSIPPDERASYVERAESGEPPAVSLEDRGQAFTRYVETRETEESLSAARAYRFTWEEGDVTFSRKLPPSPEGTLTIPAPFPFNFGPMGLA